MNVTKEAISSKISSGDTYTGCWCVFIKITATVGLKLYHSKAMRDDTQALSELGYEYGFAPRCWGSFEMELPDDFSGLASHDKPQKWQDQGHAFGFFTEIVNEDDVREDDAYELMDAMSAEGFYIGDLGSYNNLGYCKKTGNLLCYDWDIQFNDFM